MQLEALLVASETIGEDDVRTGIHKALVERRYSFGLIEVPELWRLPRFQAGREVIGARGTVGQQHSTFGQQLGQGRAH